MTRDEIVAAMGAPDSFVFGVQKAKRYQDADVWTYGGVEFSFLGGDGAEQDNILQNINFKPYILLLPNQGRALDLWLFASANLTVQQLRAGLDNEGIPFKDTGLEIFRFNEEIKRFELIPYKKDAELEDREELCGTLVLKNGIQIRYDGLSNEIIRVGLGGKWTVEGQERFIHFD